MHQPISRRTVLKASGVAIALPFLESMNPVLGRDKVKPPRRMVLICNTLGLHPPSLFPKTPGSNYEGTEYLDLLSEHRDDYTLFSGLSHPDQNGKQPHDTEITWLTAARNPGLAGFRNSISVDQLAVASLGSATRFSSIALSSNTQKSQSYTRNGVMIPAQDKPSIVFAKLFLAGSAEEVQRQRLRLAEGRSILDFVAEQTRSLKRKTSGIDRQQLDEYFSAIREAEAELAENEAWLDRPKPVVNEKQPADVSDLRDLVGRAGSLLNLIPLILQTDSSRIVTVVIQDHGVVPGLPGVTGEHHPLSHHGQDPDKIRQLKIIETALLNCFGDFLSRMKQPHEADHRLLDSTSVLLGSNLGNANAHDPTNLPVVLAGGGFKHGEYVKHDENNNTPLCNLFVSLLNSMGGETDSFATSTGTLQLS